MNSYQKLISCWHKLEYFTPALAPKLSSANVDDLQTAAPFWHTPIKAKNPKKTIEYSVFLGVFDSSIYLDFVHNVFNTNPSDLDSRNQKIAYAALRLDQNGNYIGNSFSLSTLPFALAKLAKQQLATDDWESDFEKLTSQIIDYIDAHFTPCNIGNPATDFPLQVVSAQQLLDLQQWIIEKCGWQSHLNPQIIVKWQEKFLSKKQDGNQVTSDILNSFYLKDLAKIKSRLKPKEIPKAFLQYLDGCLAKPITQQDVAGNRTLLQNSLTPEHIPDGCWPSLYHLSLMQQFAVNQIFADFQSSNSAGIYSVNGPPGTGKTTLLRDIIAPILVGRAKALAAISNPADAFTKVGELQITETYSPHIYQPKATIANAGIVVASSNNGAVENISKELPSKNALSDVFQEHIAYFSDVAKNCFAEHHWGLISAVLGNKENRNKLVSQLWFHDHGCDLRTILKEKKINHLDDWQAITKQFNTKLKQIRQEKAQLRQWMHSCQQLQQYKQQLLSINQQLSEIKNTFQQSEEQLLALQNQQQTLNQAKQTILAELTIIKANKPSWLSMIFHVKKRKQYQLAQTNALAAYNDNHQQLNDIDTQLKTCQKNHQHQQSLLAELQNQQQQWTEQIATQEKQWLNGQEILGENFADEDFWQNLATLKSQQSCPWYSDKLRELNAQLFILALKLHEVFILTANAQSSRISSTLAAFFEYLKGNSDTSHAEVKAMWDTFFLVMPVVSSTFASIQTMFADLQANDIPWLFIDEAGQAVPQAAAGAIWRAQKVVVVGDPLQIEPVVTIANALTNNISEYHQLNKINIHAQLSVQTMADRANGFGTYLQVGAVQQWIGIPLTVHRRCISPMFDIANEIAYEGSMYNATKTPEMVPILFKNQFIDCKGNVVGRHYVPEQAQIVSQLLLAEIAFLGALPNLFIITPFAEISYQLKVELAVNLTRKNPTLHLDMINDWLKSHIGTVHTFQGKQADAVILCLGLDTKTQGAASWAAQKPNLLNVALTRAKYRFVAIGDADIWLTQPFFNHLKKLPISV